MSTEFGRLVNAKLVESGHSQRWLAMMIRGGPTTIHYVIHGRTGRSRGRDSKPSSGVVMDIAKVLGIPVEDALRAAGHDAKAILSKNSTASGPVYKDKEIRLSPGEKPGERPVFDIAYEAALAAIRGLQPQAPDGEPGPVSGVTIEIPGRMRIILLDAADGLTEGDIERYRQAFLDAYDSANAQIKSDKRNSG